MKYEDLPHRVEALLGSELSLDPREARAILELAYLAISADRVLGAEELEAFQHVATALRERAVYPGRALPADADPPSGDEGSDDGHALPETFGLLGDVGREVGSGPDAIRKVAKRLERDDARAAAYRIAFAMTLIDLETTDDEIALDDTLAAALGFDDARAQLLETSVYACLEAPG